MGLPDRLSYAAGFSDSASVTNPFPSTDDQDANARQICLIYLKNSALGSPRKGQTLESRRQGIGRLAGPIRRPRGQGPTRFFRKRSGHFLHRSDLDTGAPEDPLSRNPSVQS